MGNERSVITKIKFDWFNWFRWLDWLSRVKLRDRHGDARGDARAKMQFYPAGHWQLTMGVEKTGSGSAGSRLQQKAAGYRVRGSGVGTNEIHKDPRYSLRLTILTLLNSPNRSISLSPVTMMSAFPKLAHSNIRLS